MEGDPKEESKGESKNFFIKKSTMIVKNKQPIEEVYKLDKGTLGSGTYGVVTLATHLKTQ